MAHQTKIYPADSVVERAIDIFGGVPEMIYKLDSAMAEDGGFKKNPRQRVQGFRDRRRFPAPIIPHIHKLTRIPMAELIYALANGAKSEAIGVSAPSSELEES